MSEEESREEIEDIINNEEPVKEEPKPKTKAKSRAKHKIILVKESVEPVEPVIEEAIVEVVEKLKK